MQAVVTLKQESIGRRQRPRLMTAALSWLTRLFGCWHTEMSRPFTLRAESYRVCLECGAHRRFDLQSWEMTGPYYYKSGIAALYQTPAAVKVAPSTRPSGRIALRAAA